MKSVHSIPIHINEYTGCAKTDWPISVAVPYSCGVLNDCSLLELRDGASVCESQMEVTARWPDGSIRWLLVNALASIGASQKKTLHLVPAKLESTTTFQSKSISNEDEVEVDCSYGKWTCCKQEPLIQLVLPGQHPITLLKGINLKVERASTSTLEIVRFASESNDLFAHINYCFDWRSPELSEPIKLTLSAKLCRTTQWAEVDIVVHNPNAAEHPGGLWDLGDSQSFCFQQLSVLLFDSSDVSHSLKFERDCDWKELGNKAFSLNQLSSGGENWDSPVHVNADGKLTQKENGYHFNVGDELLTKGLRAEPLVKTSIDTHNFYFQPESFWQNFPKAISSDKGALTFSPFPKGHEVHELQPGEKKTHRMYFSFAEEADAVTSLLPLIATVDTDYVIQSGVIPFSIKNKERDSLESIIDLGLTHSNNFFQKREQLDEYGWRNFGDLYADHETWENETDGIFVSHYNNQYDTIYGFLRQYLITGDHSWFELGNDLAAHVKDIDIYSTEKDKAEYNNGLFWHTDHYLPAATATHRTYSKHHEVGAYQDHAGGGGPGGQHCYTSGLALHYYITGEKSSKDAVLKLTDWITNVYEGSGGFLDGILALKNSRFPGFKNLVLQQYPLDRGTGNYVNALLDSFELTSERGYLKKAIEVISHTIYPDEDIEERDLGNVELCWFYTVLLQAALRLLKIKELNNEIDDSFYSIRDAILNYVDWMQENEAPYLDKPEILEYPNHTWAAQDVRKANIFYIAAYYQPDVNKAKLYRVSGERFYQYVCKSIASEDTHYFTRILAILMQNHGPTQYFRNCADNELTGKFREQCVYPTMNRNGIWQKCKNVTSELVTRIINLSISRELNWLSLRSSRVAKIYARN